VKTPRRGRRATAGTAAAAHFAAATAVAAPPPPVLEPEALREPVDGYDMRAPYQIWRFWIERQKGRAVDALLAEPETVPGEVGGALLLRFKKFDYDFGHFLTGEIRVYCKTKGTDDVDRSTCRHRLRRAYVAHSADPGGGDNPVSRWRERNFDAAKLAAHFRALGLGPKTDWRRIDRERMFAALPSPVPMLIENATVVRLDSRECPAMSARIRALEGTAIDWRLDFAGTGRDRKVRPVWPHSVWIEYELELITPEGGEGRVGGRGPDLDRLVGPILKAADECEKRRSK
jgi:hypothetical protein